LIFRRGGIKRNHRDRGLGLAFAQGSIVQFVSERN
jgi:hypothetical protein